MVSGFEKDLAIKAELGLMLTGNHTFKLILKQKNLVTTFCFELLGLGSDGKEYACNMGDLGWEDPLEECMATHSSILPGESPWTEEPGGLQSMGHKEL